MDDEQQSQMYCSATQRRRALNRHATLLAGAGFGPCLILIIVLVLFGFPIVVVPVIAVLVLWFVVVWQGWRRTMHAVAAASAWGANAARTPPTVAPVPSSRSEARTETAELQDNHFHVYRIDVEGPGALQVGVGVLSSQGSRTGGGRLSLQILVGDRVVAADEGPWGALIDISVNRVGSYTARVSVQGIQLVEYQLSYQHQPLVVAPVRSGRRLRLSR